MQTLKRYLGLCAIAFAASGCAEVEFLSQASKEIMPTQTSAATGDVDGGNGGRYKVGDAYKIKGKWYYPKADYSYSEQGIASWYGPKFHGRKTANGAIFNMNKVSAAHRTLPLPSFVRVTNLENGRSLKVKVNDRGPYAHNRIIDLSRRAAQLLGFERQGTALVRVEALEAESRQLVTLMQGGDTKDQAPPPAAAPATSVAAENLAPPPGVETSKPTSADHVVQVASAASASDISRSDVSAPDSGSDYEVVKVDGIPQIYIQAGAFSQYSNALKTKARLASVGPTLIQQINKAERPLFRVRVGPFNKVEDADRFHDAIMNAGYPDARIVVEN